MKPTLFLDRDGTIIVDKHYLNDALQVEFLPKAIDGLKMFRDMGFQLIVVTNQSGIARGLVTEENLKKIHQRINTDLARHNLTITAFYHCPEAADSDHPDRKPNPGMLEAAIRDHNVDRTRSWMAGDKDIDVQAGKNAGVRTILIASSTPPEGTTADITANQLVNAAQQVSKLHK